MDKFQNMLINIKTKPRLFLKKPSISLLEAFICGYSTCEYENCLNAQSKGNIYPDFQEYVENFYGLETGPKGYATILLDHYKDEEIAFYKFFELFEAFSEESSEKKD